MCDICKKNNASIHYTQIINNKKREMHICEECAVKLKDNRQKSEIDDFSKFNQIFPDIMSMVGGDIFNPVKKQLFKCERCGMTFEKFKSTGMLGCAECYATFEDKLKPVLKRMHGNIVHTGKATKEAGEKLNIKREVDELKIQLKDAIAKEEYEKAAIIRDRIQALNENSKKGS